MRGPRHYYEVIVEGKCLFYCTLYHPLVLLSGTDSACRLYFDIEFKTELNPNIDGNSALDTFIKVRDHSIDV